MNWQVKRIEDMTPIELYNLLKLRSEVFVVEQDCVYLDPDGKDLKSYHLIAKDGEKIIGTIRLIPKGLSYEEASLGRVVLDKEYRGKGIADEMIQIAIKEIEHRFNERKIRISAQAYLYNYYTRAGFRKVSEIYLEDGIEHMEMLYNKKSN